MMKVYGWFLGFAGVVTLVYNGTVFVDPNASAFAWWVAVITTIMWGAMFTAKFPRA